MSSGGPAGTAAVLVPRWKITGGKKKGEVLGFRRQSKISRVFPSWAGRCGGGLGVKGRKLNRVSFV